MLGKIVQINIKKKVEGERGLPKHFVERAMVNEKGLEGDYNQHRHEKLRDGLDQAVLIMTIDKLKELKEEGWPVEFGHLGENFTIDGVNYDFFELGVDYFLGGARIRISKACNPCRNLSVLPYVGKDGLTPFMKTLIGRRGWYASVLHSSLVKVGDQVGKL